MSYNLAFLHEKPQKIKLIKIWALRKKTTVYFSSVTNWKAQKTKQNKTEWSDDVGW